MSFNALKNFDGIDKLVQSYQKVPEENLLKLIFTKLSTIIFLYPQVAFRITDEDRRADFSLYIYNRLETIVLKYEKARAAFNTYFFLKLRSHFLNFLKREKTKEKIEFVIPPIKNIFLTNLTTQRYLSLTKCKSAIQ